MTFKTSDLIDGHLPLVERIDAALRRVKMGLGPMRLPVEATDVDIVLHNCRDRITVLESEVEQLGMACGMAYALPGAGNIEVDPLRPVAKMQEIAAAVLAAFNQLNPPWINDPVRPETLIETCQRQAGEIERLTAEVEHWRSAAGVTDGPTSDGVAQL